MFLSVIVPVFNAQESVTHCVASIMTAIGQLGQAYMEAEVIIVNDGSQDQTQAIAENLAKEHPQISVIQQDNLGVSAARNRGLSAASGKWVCFVDDDDTIVDNALQLFYRNEPHADMVILRSFCKNKERYPWGNSFKPGSNYTTDAIMQKGYLRGSICGCIFNRAFLVDNGLHFPEGVRLSEDTVFFGACLSMIQTICFLDIPFYLITPRPDSASRKRQEEDLDALHQAIRATIERVPNTAVRNYTAFKLIINYTSRAVDCGVSVQNARESLSGILPLDLSGIHSERWKMVLLNSSYHLFYKLISLRDGYR